MLTLSIWKSLNLLPGRGLTHYQMTNFRLFQTERVCRRRFQIWRKWQKVIQIGRKHCGKGEIARYEQFLLFPQCFQKACFSGVSKGVIVWEWVKVMIFNWTAWAGRLERPQISEIHLLRANWYNCNLWQLLPSLTTPILPVVTLLRWTFNPNITLWMKLKLNTPSLQWSPDMSTFTGQNPCHSFSM